MQRSYTLGRSVLLAALAAATASLGVLIVSSRGLHAQDHGQSQVEIGFDISPVPINSEVKNRSLVGLGSYIANAQSGCNDCHIGAPDTRSPARWPSNGGLYLAGGRYFGPVGPAPDLTPDETGLPNGLTQQQFVDIMRTGVDPEGHPVRSTMPWETYRNMTDRDLLAIYDYLLSIPSNPGPR